jgi:hypothetical protein
MLTQHRPQGALAGRRFGLFSGKTADTGSAHPVGVLTQHRPDGAIAGRRYGSFADKAVGSEWELVAPIPTDLVGTLSVSGDFAFTTDANPVDIVETGPVALSGTLAVSGEFAYSDAPIEQPTSGGGRRPRRRRRPATNRYAEAGPMPDTFPQDVAAQMIALLEAGVFHG